MANRIESIRFQAPRSFVFPRHLFSVRMRLPAKLLGASLAISVAFAMNREERRQEPVGARHAVPMTPIREASAQMFSWSETTAQLYLASAKPLKMAVDQMAGRSSEVLGIVLANRDFDRAEILEALVEAARLENIDAINALRPLLKLPRTDIIPPGTSFHRLLESAAEQNQPDLVSLLMNDYDDQIEQHKLGLTGAYYNAAKYGYVDVIKVLLEHAKAHGTCDEFSIGRLIRQAARHDQKELVAYLMQHHFNPHNNDQYLLVIDAIVSAASMGHHELGHYLLRRVDQEHQMLKSIASASIRRATRDKQIDALVQLMEFFQYSDEIVKVNMDHALGAIVDCGTAAQLKRLLILLDTTSQSPDVKILFSPVYVAAMKGKIDLLKIFLALPCACDPDFDGLVFSAIHAAEQQRQWVTTHLLRSHLANCAAKRT